MADDASVQLEFHDHALIPLLFGDHDRNLARIEQKLGVKLEAFGNVVRILGAEEALQAARGTLEALYRRLEKTKKKGQDPYPFEIGDVDAAVKYAQAADAAEGVREFAGDTGLDTWKRPIGARSPWPAPCSRPGGSTASSCRVRRSRRESASASCPGT
jgi:phosphate starvation-inducible PhoH-like protein